MVRIYFSPVGENGKSYLVAEGDNLKSACMDWLEGSRMNWQLSRLYRRDFEDLLHDYEWETGDYLSLAIVWPQEEIDAHAERCHAWIKNMSGEDLFARMRPVLGGYNWYVDDEEEVEEK